MDSNDHPLVEELLASGTSSGHRWRLILMQLPSGPMTFLKGSDGGFGGAFLRTIRGIGPISLGYLRGDELPFLHGEVEKGYRGMVLVFEGGSIQAVEVIEGPLEHGVNFFVVPVPWKPTELIAMTPSGGREAVNLTSLVSGFDFQDET